MEESGESVAVIKPGYRINCIRPCGEEGKKILEAKLPALDVKAALPLIEKAFGHAEHFPKLGLVRFDVHAMNVLLYASGELVFRKVVDISEAVHAVEKIAAALKLL